MISVEGTNNDILFLAKCEKESGNRVCSFSSVRRYQERESVPYPLREGTRNKGLFNGR
jgi:hypothetical protein